MKSKRNSTHWFSVALAVGLMVSGIPAIAAGPPSGLDVRVVNTPLPVQGTVAISNLPTPVATQIVTLKADLSEIGACPGFGGKTGNFNKVLASDGSSAAFTIPPGTVLVVTAVDLLGIEVAPNASIQTRLFRGGTIFSIRESIASASGRIFHRYEFPSGVEVASPLSVCTNANDNDLGTSGFLYGYLKSAQ
jgi:hypothetical protein